MLEKIRTFVAVVEKKSFVKAADVLGLSPSVVTRRIGQLEQEVDDEIVRKGKNVVNDFDASQEFIVMPRKKGKS